MSSVYQITTININESQVIWGGLGLVFVIFLIISAILVYHWKKYGIHQNTVRAIMIIYFTVAAMLWYALINQGFRLLS